MKRTLTIDPNPPITTTPTTTTPLAQYSFVPTPANGRLEFSDYLSNPPSTDKSSLSTAKASASPVRVLSPSKKNLPLTFLANTSQVSKSLSFEDGESNVVKDSSEKENSANVPRAVLT